MNNKRINSLYYKFPDKYILKIIFINQLKDMNYLFFGCSSLSYLNLSNFNTNNVNDMSFLFTNCSSLSYLNLYILIQLILIIWVICSMVVLL